MSCIQPIRILLTLKVNYTRGTRISYWPVYENDDGTVMVEHGCDASREPTERSKTQ